MIPRLSYFDPYSSMVAHDRMASSSYQIELSGNCLAFLGAPIHPVVPGGMKIAELWLAQAAKKMCWILTRRDCTIEGSYTGGEIVESAELTEGTCIGFILETTTLNHVDSVLNNQWHTSVPPKTQPAMMHKNSCVTACWQSSQPRPKFPLKCNGVLCVMLWLQVGWIVNVV